jgi:hypothetical protein
MALPLELISRLELEGGSSMELELGSGRELEEEGSSMEDDDGAIVELSLAKIELDDSGISSYSSSSRSMRETINTLSLPSPHDKTTTPDKTAARKSKVIFLVILIIYLKKEYLSQVI